MNGRIRCVVLSVVAWAGLMPGMSRLLAADPAAEEQQLIGVLQSDAPPAEKAITCKRLAVVGSGRSVPALRPLLEIEELSSWARIALEVIPDPAADAALRDALRTVKGRPVIGVINSLGVRRDRQAVEALAARLNDPEPQLASAAALALGKIGGEAATAALLAALPSAPPDVRSAVAEGCVLCAEQLLAAGKAPEAATIYDQVRTADVPRQRQREATRGLLLARGPEGLPLLAELLSSPDRDLFRLGLQSSEELSGEEVTRALLGQLDKATSERQSLLLAAVAVRDDDAVLPALLHVAQTGRPPVRATAVELLQHAANATAVPALLEIAAGDDAQLAATATATIANISDKQVDQQIQARLPNATGKLRRVLVELAGLRRVDAVGLLITAAQDEDAELRRAALTALGETVGLDRLEVLIASAVTPRDARDQEVAIKALHTAAVRMPDRDACARQLAAVLPRAARGTQEQLLTILAAVGGTEALRTVGAAAADKHPQLQETASRLLGEWMTADAAPVLLELAKTSSEAKYQVRALRGYLRIVRQFDLPLAERTAMCRAALAAARRDDERLLVLDVVKRYPSAETLALAAEMSATPSLKAPALAALTEIAPKTPGDAAAQLADALKRSGLPPVKLEIVEARYGAESHTIDVTEQLRKHAGQLPLVILPSARFNDHFGGDPAPGQPKKLSVRYKLDGQAGSVDIAEDGLIFLPRP